MKNIFLIPLVLLSFTVDTSAVLADTYVQGHTRRDGTYVQGHTRSAPDAYRSNNYGSESRGGNRRDEYSTDSATNKSNSSGYSWRDNDKDGALNPYDKKPESKRGGW